MTTTATPNQSAPPNAGIASGLTLGDHWPGVGEPGRWAKIITVIHLKYSPNNKHIKDGYT
jgi:hypothetical protein